MTCDELLIEHECRKGSRGMRRMCRSLVPVVAYLSIIIVAALGVEWGFCDEAMAQVAACLGAAAAVAAMVTIWVREERYAKAMQSRLQEVPLGLRCTAMRLYGSSDWQMSAIECHEGHLPGDCPLCGAGSETNTDPLQ